MNEIVKQIKTNYWIQTDLQTQFNELDLKDSEANEFERKHVYEIYDKIAGEFSDSRYRAWPNVKKFIEELPIGTILVDLGTGNGKNLNLNKNVFSIGCDTSINLLDICRKNQYECLAANVLNLPFKRSSIDACIFIAVLHHLVTEQRRLEALKNIVQILKTGGVCLTYVWAFEQELKGSKSNYIKQKYDLKFEETKCIPVELSNENKNEKDKNNDNVIEQTEQCNEGNDYENKQKNELNKTKLIPIHYNGTKFRYQDCFVPWKKKNQIIPLEKTDLRFYHLFKENELDFLISKLDDVEIIDSFYDNGNWAVKFRKV